MRYLRTLGLLLCLFMGFHIFAQYNPENPPEPNEPQVKYGLTLVSLPSEGASLTGAGSYEAGKSISVKASVKSGFVFSSWEDSEGNVLSTSANFSYVMPERDVILYARMLYSPSNPSEPSEPAEREEKEKLILNVNPAESGTVTGAGQYVEGTVVNVKATAKSSFTFLNWTKDGKVISNENTFKYTILKGDNSLTANFEYTPSSPSEPTEPSTKRKLYLKVIPEGSGSVLPAAVNSVAVGTDITLNVSVNSSFKFVNWKDEKGNVVSSTKSFSYTMPDQNVTLVANLEYSPDNPSEPSEKAPQRNIIYGGRLSVVPGSEIFYDVNLENVDKIHGMNIDITMPEGFSADYTRALTTTRASSHTISIQDVDASTTRIFVRGDVPFEGGSGSIIRVPVKIPSNVTYGEIHDISMSHGVLVAPDGSQTTVDVVNGILKIVDAEIKDIFSPDFVVSQIEAPDIKVKPGESFDVSWTVVNNGNLDASGGWSETFSLINTENRRVVLGSRYYDTNLFKVGESVKRNTVLNIPDLPGIHGNLDVRIDITPSAAAGELEENQINNISATDNTPVHLEKLLYLSMPESFEEGESVRASISRSGDWSQSETFTIKQISGDSRLEIPETVLIPRDQSTAYFWISAKDNQELDDNADFCISVEGNGYPEVQSDFMVSDNEGVGISIEPSVNEVAEGETFNLKVKIDKASSSPVNIEIVSEKPQRFKYSKNVVIPAGQTTVDVEILALDNNEIEFDEYVEFIAASPDYSKGVCEVLLKDNDIPDIEMTLSQYEVVENAGASAIVATIRRTTNIDKKVTLKLTDNAPKKMIQYPNGSYIMASGVESLEIPLSIVDNQEVDGDRTIQITAYIYASTCSCSSLGTGIGEVTRELTIIDNDGPSLSLSAASSVILEGGKPVKFTLSRNTDTSAPLTVSVSSDNDESLSYQHEITIKASEKSVSFDVSALKNSTSGDDRVVSFKAEAEGFSKGLCTVMVSDQNLPDAKISHLSFSEDNVVAGDEVGVKVVLENNGSAPLPDATEVKLYQSGKLDPVTAIYTEREILGGESEELTAQIAATAGFGLHSFYAVVNEKKYVKEISYSNNTSGNVSLNIVSPYSASISSDKKIYKAGEEVILSGKLSGRNIGNTDVEVYIVNGSFRDKLNTSTDSEGNFSCTYLPASNLTGHFLIGACFPGENLRKEIDCFDIYGISVQSISVNTIKAYLGENYTGYINLRNPGTLPLTGLKVNIADKPDGVKVKLDYPDKIDGGATVRVNFTLTPDKLSEGDEWDILTLNIETAEDISVSKRLYYYCYAQEGSLKADIDKIKVNVLKDSSREFSFNISNIGKGETGVISLSLPSWISALSSIEMPSLKNNEEARVVLKITPKADWQLNVPITGAIGVNCANGRGFSLPYSVEPVSDRTGTLVVDVCDEYTYYTSEAPHVSGAQVVISHPVTGAMITQGLTGNDGLCSITLPEGWYKVKVTHDRHDSYTNNIYVDPGTVTDITVDLSVSAVKITYTVEETEVEDEYEIVTSYTYETNVPAPVVTVTQQGTINGDDMLPGESRLIYLLYTNKGLITAREFEIGGMSAQGWEFSYLVEECPDELEPQSTFILPVLVTKTGDPGSLARSFATYDDYSPNNIHACFAGVAYRYKWICGKSIKTNTGAYLLGLKNCVASAALGSFMSSLGSWSGFGGGSLPNTPNPKYPPNKPTNPESKKTDNHYTEKDPNPIEREPLICDPDYSRCGNDIWNALAGNIPVVGSEIGIASSILDNYAGARLEGRKPTGKETARMIFDVGRSIAGLIFPPMKLINVGIDMIEVIYGCHKHLKKLSNRNKSTRSVSMEFPENSWGESLVDYTAELELVGDICSEFYGNDIWMELNIGSLSPLEEAIEALDNKDNLAWEDLLPYKPASVSKGDFILFVERLNGINPQNTFNVDLIKEKLDSIAIIEKKAMDAGFESAADKCKTHLKESYEALNDPSGSVCSKVRLEISQSMVMTRQAFRGTLTIENGSDENPVTDIKLMLTIISEEGDIATSHEFQTSLESLNGFSGDFDMEAGWKLNAKDTGVATVLFIPTKFAAPAKPCNYTFGGAISYVDPYTGMQVTRELATSELTVKPSPDLDLTYFMQRDVYGDDPLTPDIIEPSVPAEFALVINNIGNGEATNLRMVTNQPKIIENEKGLFIDFELLGGSINGEEQNLAFGSSISSDFGNIPAHSSAYAQWWLRSSLLGHFSDYDVKVNHISSYGNEDLSLLNEVSIHELIHGFTVDEEREIPLRGFLVNDIADFENMPDRVYFSDGTGDVDVAADSHMIMDKINDNQFRLKLSPASKGWNYASVSDKSGGRRFLLSAIRESDGVEVPTDNFWFTDRTMRDALTPVNEKRCHMIAYSESEDSWLLTFEERPALELDVVEFFDVPEESQVLAEPLKTIGVKFNKPIVESSFTTEDLSLYCQGKRMDLSNVTIDKLTDDKYKINLSGVTNESGYYVLTIMTQGILDNEGFNGEFGRSYAWLQNMEASVDMIVVPEKGSLRLYPKPMKDQVYTSGDFDFIESMSFFDASGNLKLRKENVGKGEPVEVSTLSPGIYIIKVETDRGVFIEKTLKK